MRAKGREESSFSEEKEAKRLLLFDAVPGVSRVRQMQEDKSFLLLFFKKEESLTLLSRVRE
jgi:hypothetical protein